MAKGKDVCEVLKDVRRKVAAANEIDYEPRVCHHEGDCTGTCPACEAEVRYIERELNRRRRLGKAVVVTGLSLGLAAMTASCSFKPNGMLESGTPVRGKMPAATHLHQGDKPDSTEVMEPLAGIVPVEVDPKEQLMGDVVCEPPDSTQPSSPQ